jgi:hypothetical protein
MEDLMIKVPRPRGVSKVRLMNVLYALSIGYTLISLSQVDCAGYSTIIMEGILNLVDHRDNSIIGEISQENGIWQVKHDIPDLAHAPLPSDPVHASLAINVDILHWMLGHISPAVVAKLMKDGWISGIELTDDNATFCETCAASKIKCLPFLKEHLNPVIVAIFIILGQPPLTHIPYPLYSPDLIIQSTPLSRDLILSIYDIIHDIMIHQA